MRHLKHLILLIFFLTCIEAASQGIRIPRSIDGTGKTDVSDELNSFFDSVDDGSTVVFPRGKTFRVEGILRIRNKKHLVIRGNGSSIVAETTGEDVPVPVGKPKHNWPRSREHLSIEKSNFVHVTGLSIRGAHSKGGLSDKAYVKDLEAQHGVNIYGSRNITLDSMRVTNVFGDCIYIGDGAAKLLSDSVVIKNSFLGFTGRQGIAITHGSNIVVENCEFTDVRRTHIDLEANNVRAMIKNVVVKHNIFRTSRLNWISAAGKGNTTEIYIVANQLLGKEANATLGNRKYKNFGQFYFIDNTSDREMGNPHGAAWRIINVDGFYASGNNIAFKKNRNMYLVGQSNSRNVVLKDNDSAHLKDPLKDL